MTSGYFPVFLTCPYSATLRLPPDFPALLAMIAQCLTIVSLSKPDKSLFSFIVDKELSGAIVTRGTLLRGHDQQTDWIGHTTLLFSSALKT